MNKIKNALHIGGHHGHQDTAHTGHGHRHEKHGVMGHNTAPYPEAVVTTVGAVPAYAPGVANVVVHDAQPHIAQPMAEPVGVARVSETEVYETRAHGTGATPVVHEHTQGTVCDRREFVEVEDRPVLKERVERVVEHNQVEKRYVVETRPVGEQLLADRINVESAGVAERVIDRAEGTVCPTTATAAIPVGATQGVETYNACADGSCAAPRREAY